MSTQIGGHAKAFLPFNTVFENCVCSLTYVFEDGVHMAYNKQRRQLFSGKLLVFSGAHSID